MGGTQLTQFQKGRMYIVREYDKYTHIAQQILHLFISKQSPMGKNGKNEAL